MRKEEVIYQVKNELLGALDLLEKLEDKLLGVSALTKGSQEAHIRTIGKEIGQVIENEITSDINDLSSSIRQLIIQESLISCRLYEEQNQ